MSDLKTAVSEVFTNIVVHAYPNGEGYAIVKVASKCNKIEVTIANGGVGIKDLEQAQQSLYTTKADGERSGIWYWLYIYENFYGRILSKNAENSKGLIVRMIKEFKNTYTI